MDNKTQRMNIVLSLTAFAVVIVIVCVVGIYTFNHREPEIVQGQAEASEYRVSSKVPGRILKILVHEGQSVHAGEMPSRRRPRLCLVPPPPRTQRLRRERVRSRYRELLSCGRKLKPVWTYMKNPTDVWRTFSRRAW